MRALVIETLLVALQVDKDIDIVVELESGMGRVEISKEDIKLILSKLDPEELAILRIIARHKQGVSLGELLRELSKPKSTLHKMLQRLEKLGYLERIGAGKKSSSKLGVWYMLSSDKLMLIWIPLAKRKRDIAIIKSEEILTSIRNFRHIPMLRKKKRMYHLVVAVPSNQIVEILDVISRIADELVVEGITVVGAYTYRIFLTLKTPTILMKGDIYYPLPEPTLILKDLTEKLLTLGFRQPPEDLLEWAKTNVAIRSIRRLESRRIHIDDKELIGFLGEIELVILEEKYIEETSKILSLANYISIGELTIYGFGQAEVSFG